MKTKLHARICDDLNKLYERKNHDYGDSFGKSFAEYGMSMPCIRLEDKLNRLKALTRSGNQQVSDESIDDTLMDLANYAIMTLVERKTKDGEKPKKADFDDSIAQCMNCKHQQKKMCEYPCNECWLGEGEHENILYWEAKTDATR